MAYNGRRGSSIAEGSALVMVSSYIAWYLFLAGAGGGAFLLGSFVDFALRVSNRSWLRGASAVTDAGLLAGPVLVALGTVFLALDLGAPDQAFRLFLTPSGSLLSAGAWALALFCATAFAAFLMGFSDDGPGLRVAETVVSVFAALLALFVVLYAGVFLSLYPAVPFLNSPLVPIVFVASALATGAAVLTIMGFFRFSRDETIGGFASLLRLDAVLVAIEAIAIAAFIIVSLMGDEAAAHSAAELLSGHSAMLFWLGVVLAGIVVPLSVDVECLRSPNPSLFVVGAASTLLGGICLRFSLLVAAERFCLVDMSLLSFWM